MKLEELYTSGEYLEKWPTWHVERSPWSAKQIKRMMMRHGLTPKTVCEVGCGAVWSSYEAAKEASFCGSSRFDRSCPGRIQSDGTGEMKQGEALFRKITMEGLLNSALPMPN